MTLKLDHFMYAASNLEALQETFRGLTGIDADKGGVHPGLGTRNALAALGSDVYIELIAPDPKQSVPGSWGERFGGFVESQIFTYVVKCADLEHCQAQLKEMGFQSELIEASRTTPSGAVLRWRLLLPVANPFENYFPIFIDWLDTRHPAQTIVKGCTLTLFEIGHVRAPELSHIFSVLGVDLPVLQADRPYFQVRLDTPQGLVILNSSN